MCAKLKPLDTKWMSCKKRPYKCIYNNEQKFYLKKKYQHSKRLGQTVYEVTLFKTVWEKM